MTIRPTRDLELVRAIITHPSQWDAATDDASGAAADWRPNPDERIIYLELQSGGTAAGVFTLIPRSSVCYAIHAAILPGSWGAPATAALRAAIAWAFRHTPARRIIAEIPATNRLAIALARRADLEQYGRNPNSVLKRGRLVDEVLLGVSR